ncbi:MAG TPA: D-alanyl-D-alanine carboxypeptidase family protein [Candidatus Limnocylindria bacterium]|nr:D-alanyl-D-alanine carboxypeptidase family protein [Candidatus Limnocylindria bacterium]
MKRTITALAAVAFSAGLAMPAAADSHDTAPPLVVALAPEPRSVAGTAVVVMATFNEPVVNLHADTFVLHNANGVRVDAAVEWDPGTLTASLRPMSRLRINTDYRATLRRGIRDEAGNALAPLSWTFHTTSRVSFPAGRYTGYRFDEAETTFRAIRRITFADATTARASRFRAINSQGYLRMRGGALDGFWVHGLPWGRAQDDHTAPITFRPACTYVDLPTARTGYGQWASTVLDTLFRLPRGYAPGDLVDTARAGLNGGHLVRAFVVADLRAMVGAARNAGAYLAVQSAYRSYHGQVATFDYWVDRIGYAEALKVSARPGHSEHQLGTTIDFRSAGGSAPWGGGDWGATREGTWMMRNAWKYGWVLSYPQGQFALSCYSYEPWHWRYVGPEAAAAIHDAQATPRRYLWSRGYGVR